MKKTLLCCLSMAAVSSLCAQSRGSAFSVYFDAGYAAPHAGNLYNSNGFFSSAINGTENYTTPSGVNVIDYNKASYAAGASLTLGATYMFNNHFGVDLGINAGIAPKKYTYEYTTTYPTGNVIDSRTSQLNMPIYVLPSLIISTGNNQALSAYMRMGLGFPIGGKMIVNSTTTDNITSDVFETEEEYKFGMSKALQGGLGFNYQLNPNLSIYGEARGMALTRHTKSSELVLATTNGVDDLPFLTTSQKQVEYSANFTYDPVTQTATPNQPSREPIITVPSSNFGVSVGARLSLSDLGIPSAGPDTNAPIGRFYGQLGLGFARPHAGNMYNGDGFGAVPIRGTESYNSSTSQRVIDFKKASYGGGIYVNVGAGYWFNPHLAGEIGVGIGVSPQKNEYTYDVSDSVGLIYTEKSITRAKMPVLVTPALVVSTGCNKPLSAYARAGIVLPFGGNVINNRVQVTSATNSKWEEEEEYEFMMSKGLTGALGVNYNIGSSMGLFAELSGTSLTRYAKSSEITLSEVNGVDQLGTYSVYQRETQYSTETTFDPATVVPGSPRQASAISMPFSYWQFGIGARFRF